MRPTGQLRCDRLAALGPLAAALAIAAGCGDPVLRSVCRTDADCAGRALCISGACVEPPGATGSDAGDPFVCQNPCGSACCAETEECRLFCVPRCESGIWCGHIISEVCCPAGYSCERGQCVPPPEPPPTCEEGEWDEAWGGCLEPTPKQACAREPEWGEPEVLWRVSPDDGFSQVLTTPVVVDVDGDGVSDVVAPFFADVPGAHTGPAVLRALSGVDGRELWSYGPAEDGLTGISQIAAGVLEVGEGVVVLGVDPMGRLVAFDGATGEIRWKSRGRDGGPEYCDIGWGAPALADLEGDARPEVICGFAVFDYHGVLKWRGAPANGPWGPIVVIADLNLDGRLDLTDGSRAYRHDGAVLWELDSKVGGLAAVGDFVSADGSVKPDGWPEIVVTRWGWLELRDAASGMLLTSPFLLPMFDGMHCWSHIAPAGIGGAPALADLNGDPVPEVVVGSGECIAAMYLQPGGAGYFWRMFWGDIAVDDSSRTSGAALFDFDADGMLDVVYADETRLHVLDGRGAPKFERSHCSGTVYENPVVADVDGDGSANIVLASNDVGGKTVGCDGTVPAGITVLRERRSRWANARRIWNQHAYAVTNVCDGADKLCAGLGPVWGAHGVIPMENVRAWAWSPEQGESPRPLNAARANSRGPWRPGGAPNAKISHVKVDTGLCPAAYGVRVRVVNAGEVPLRPRTPVTVQSIDGPALSVTLETSRPIAPGAGEVLTFLVQATGGPRQLVAKVDADDTTAECAEDDNAFTFTAACP